MSVECSSGRWWTTSSGQRDGGCASGCMRSMSEPANGGCALRRRFTPLLRARMRFPLLVHSESKQQPRSLSVGQERGNSRARLSPHPPNPLPLKCRVFGRDERCSAFPCAFAPLPPNPLLPHGEKVEFGRPEAQNERRNAGASAWVRGRPLSRGAFLGTMRGVLYSRARLPPHPPNPLFPHGEKGVSGRPDA